MLAIAPVPNPSTPSSQSSIFACTSEFVLNDAAHLLSRDYPAIIFARDALFDNPFFGVAGLTIYHTDNPESPAKRAAPDGFVSSLAIWTQGFFGSY